MNDLLVKPLESITANTDTRSSIIAKPGGSAANQAAWMARCGAAVRFVARVGSSDRALHLSELASHGVDARLAADPVVATGASVVMVAPNGDRTMFVDRGANLRLSREDVPSSLLDDIDAVHLTGYSLVEPTLRGVVLSLLADVRARGLPFTVDPSSAAFLQPLPRGDFTRWTAGAAVCFPNIDEGAVLTGEQDPEFLAQALLDHYTTVVVKRGQDGVLVAQRGRATITVPAVATTAYDSTGAGDAFCGAFLSRWYCDPDPVQAARAGVQAAALALGSLGARPPTPPRQGGTA